MLLLDRQILCLGEQSFQNLLFFFPLKKIRPSELAPFMKIFSGGNIVVMEANAFEFRVFAQRQFALKDFAI